MSWTFFDIARRNLRRNFFRSMLAIVGIVIGVLAISSLGILGNSLTLSVTEQTLDRRRFPDRDPALGRGLAVRRRRSRRRRRYRTGRSRTCGGSPHRTR